MAWKSIHWAHTDLRQKTRFERYADDSWMFLVSIFGHLYIAFKGAPSNRHYAKVMRARRAEPSNTRQEPSA